MLVTWSSVSWPIIHNYVECLSRDQVCPDLTMLPNVSQNNSLLQKHPPSSFSSTRPLSCMYVPHELGRGFLLKLQLKEESTHLSTRSESSPPHFAPYSRFMLPTADQSDLYKPNRPNPHTSHWPRPERRGWHGVWVWEFREEWWVFISWHQTSSFYSAALTGPLGGKHCCLRGGPLF